MFQPRWLVLAMTLLVACSSGSQDVSTSHDNGRNRADSIQLSADSGVSQPPSADWGGWGDSGVATDAVDGDGSPATDGGARTDAGSIQPAKTIFADDGRVLYAVDPTTLAATRIGTYAWPSGATNVWMTDLATSASGKLYGIAWNVLYQVDPRTAKLTKVGPLTHRYNSLSFAFLNGSGSTEILVGATREGTKDSELYAIDVHSARETLIGTYGAGLKSSGDLVYLPGIGLMATVVPSSNATDRLARVNIKTGKATIIGDTGFIEFWGLGASAGDILGFNYSGAIMSIDSSTGKATQKVKTSIRWYSASVAPVKPSSP